MLKVESCIVSKNDICYNIFWPCFHLETNVERQNLWSQQPQKPESYKPEVCNQEVIPILLSLLLFIRWWSIVCTFWSCTLTWCRSNELVPMEMMHSACKPIITLSPKCTQQNWDLMQDEVILQDEPFMKPGLRNASKHCCSSSHCICFTIVGSH